MKRLLLAAAVAAAAPMASAAPPVTDDGTITTPSFQLPFSSYASPQARDAFVRRLRAQMPVSKDIVQMRKGMDEGFFGPRLAKARALYPYSSVRSSISGVPVETFTPHTGIAPENRDRVLINLHGGGFILGGGGVSGAVESVPIAGVGRIKVISVDYRMAPEHRFPAASEDVTAVYRELLKTYRPENIGIYGCSAGGLLTGQMIPWLLKEKLPLPGAIGIFCASTHRPGEGDSAQVAPQFGSILGGPPPKLNPDDFGGASPYYVGASPKDPLAAPAASKAVLKAFPPTLFLTGTRAPEASAAAESHLELAELGVKSELLLFDGMDHGFFNDPELPESARAYRLITKFFAEHLGDH
jgi:monoterpene epsilon-lactone hydrolase